MARIDGKKISEAIAEELREKMQKTNKGTSLVVFLVGDDPASKSFIAQKEKFGNSIGVSVRVLKTSSSIEKEELRERIIRETAKEDVAGVIVQLPLPPRFPKKDTREILDAIPAAKDPDFLSSFSLGQFYAGVSRLLPPPISAVDKVLRFYDITFPKGAVATIIGQGGLIGKPLAAYLIREEFTVLSTNKHTRNLSDLTRISDLLISGASVPGLVRGDMVKKGSVVLDFGFSRNGETIRGDIEQKSVQAVARFVSPVPGGLGPVTVSMLFYNLLELSVD